MKKDKSTKCWFVADEHYGHENIISYCNRPFASVEEMDNEIIRRNNEVVGDDDIVIHCGDFTLIKDINKVMNYVRRLKGEHIFLKGSHDYWAEDSSVGRIDQIWEREINGIYVVACHYAMRVWPRSHHGSIQVHGHSHGNLPCMENQLDVGVDCNNYYPLSLEQVVKIIKKLKPVYEE